MHDKFKFFDFNGDFIEVRNYVPGELSDFFKTVARNRCVNVEFFSNRPDALTWLGFRDNPIDPQNAQ